MAKLTKEQMRAYQRERRERLKRKVVEALKPQYVPKVLKQPAVTSEKSIWTVVGALEKRVKMLEAREELRGVVEETVRGIPARRGSSVGVVSDKTLFQRVVDEKERRVRG